MFAHVGAASDPATCRVKNTTSGTGSLGRGLNLQKAIREAGSGDTLIVRGLCVGTFIVHHRIQLQGRRNRTSVVPTLDGGGRGSVLWVRGFGGGPRVLVRSLRITDGFAQHGAGIFNTGHLRLAGTTRVFGNRARFDGGGVYNDGVLVLQGSATVWHNAAGYGGGGIYNEGAFGRGHLVLKDHGSVRGNRSRDRAGGIYNYGATVALRGSAFVKANMARTYGGGIENTKGRVSLNGYASVIRNRAGRAGGGIYARLGTVYKCSTNVMLKPNQPNDVPMTTPCPEP